MDEAGTAGTRDLARLLDEVARTGAKAVLVGDPRQLPEIAPDFDPVVAAGLSDAWFAGQDHWASLSSNSEVVYVDNAGHNVHLDQPELVIQQITELLSPLS